MFIHGKMKGLKTMLLIILFYYTVDSGHGKIQKAPLGIGEGFISCNSTSPLNTSKDICGDLCEKSALCESQGVCVCAKEPKPTMLGSNFVHCTNWMYVQQDPCKKSCLEIGKSDSRVCWTILIGNYCTCFEKNSTSTIINSLSIQLK